MKTTLFIIRHAEAEGNVGRVFHGVTDSFLTPKGHKQCERLAEELFKEDFDVIISSPLNRTRQTAEYILKGREKKLFFDEDLKEINGGKWEECTWQELSEKWPKEYETWDLRPHLHQMPDGDSVASFQKRLIGAFDKIIKEHKGKKICVVTHGTGIKTLMCHFKGVALSQMVFFKWFDNTAITVVEHSDEGFNLLKQGDDSHLPDNLKTVKHQDWVEDLEKRVEALKVKS